MTTGSPILVTGASGVIGSRLVDRLVAEGERPVVAGRRPDALRARYPDLEARELDALRGETVGPAVSGVRVAYYFIHSMEPGAVSFDERDRSAARNFGRAARSAGVERVIFLGGLGEEHADLSEHLASRHETGRVLSEEGPPLLEFRAAMVVGSGSASFQMLSDLVKRLPAMVVPRWVDTRSQPIAMEDVISYLGAGRSVPLSDRRTIVEIGGADVLTYRQMMEAYARLDGKRRLIVGVPFLTPRLSSLWCGMTTTVPTSVARPLIDGMVNETIVHGDRATELFPGITPMGFERALRLASQPG